MSAPSGYPGMPPAPPIAGPVGTVRSLRVPATATQIGLAVSGLATLLLLGAVWQRRSALVDMRDGGPRITLGRANELDDAVARGFILSIVVFLVTAGFFIWWFHRAYCNLATVRRVDHATGWAIGSWFIPIFNLLRPAQIANEIGTHSPEPKLNRPPLVISWWWGLLMVNVLAGFVIRFDTDTLSGLIKTDTANLVTLLVRLVDTGFAIAAVRNITAAQRTRFGQYAG